MILRTSERMVMCGKLLSGKGVSQSASTGRMPQSMKEFCRSCFFNCWMTTFTKPSLFTAA